MPGPRPYMPPRPAGYAPMRMGGYDNYWTDDRGYAEQNFSGYGYPRPMERGGYYSRGGPGPMRGRGGHRAAKGSFSKNGSSAVKTPAGAAARKVEEAKPVEGVKISGDGSSAPVVITAKPDLQFIAGGEMKSFSATVSEGKAFIGPVKPGEGKEQIEESGTTTAPPKAMKHFELEGEMTKIVKPTVPASEKKTDPLYGAEESWPDELMDKFSEFECLLCGSKMNSRTIAQTHYDGKTHEKKLRMYFGAYAQNTGMPLYYYLKRKERKPPAPTPAVTTTPAPDGTISADGEAKAVPAANHELYCNICQIAFTSISHKTQHEQGRNHQRKAVGLPPLKTGYFNNSTGRWHRLPTNESNKRLQESVSANLAPIGGGGSALSGMTYSTDDGQKVRNLATLVPSDADTTVKYIFECKLCAVTAPTQAQLDVHLQGQKHRMKMERKDKIEKQIDMEKKGFRPKPYNRTPARSYSQKPPVDYTQKWWTTPATIEHFN